MKKRSSGLGVARRGFALVVALIAVVLITILILAFFAKAILNRQVSFSSTNQIKADMLARSALDLITGELRQEIVDYSDKTNGIYMPKAATNVLPIPLGVANADTNTAQFTIAKVAGDNTPVDPGAGGRLRGSAVSVGTASRNGRSQSRWFDSGPKLGTADLPTWAYLTRDGAASNSLTAAEARDPASTNFVIGRFSYTVYNTSGLLNANVAGYSTNLVASTNASLLSKSSLAYADLTALGITADKLAAFTGWRNARTGTNATSFEQWASGIAATNSPNREALAAAASGYTETVIGDNAFLSRRDLVRYLETHGFPTNAAASFSHTFRALEAPSWGPTNVAGANIDYGDDANTDTSINRFVPGVRAYNGKMRLYADDGTFKEINVTENDPLVQTRFSLAKLAWLGHNGPNTTAFNPTLTAAQREEAIRDCFGLKWHNSSGGTSSDARWEYDHGNPNDIMILGEVREEDRAPDFFELLKAGILSKSLGGEPGAAAFDVASDDSANWEGPIGRDFESFSADEDRHILQIGANIIDQADANNYPTAIYMDLTPSSLYSGSELEFYNTVFGLENLPLLQRMCLISAMPNTSGPGLAPMGNWLQMELWNPHERSTAWTTSNPETPTSLRLATYGEVRVQNLEENPASNFGDFFNFGKDFHNPDIRGIINFRIPSPTSTVPLNFLDRPRLVGGPGKNSEDYSDPNFPLLDDKNRYPDGVTFDPAGVANPLAGNRFLGVFIGEVQHNPFESDGTTPNRYELRTLISPTSPLTFVLEYYDGASWRPYQSMSRVASLKENSGTDNTNFGRSEPGSGNGHVDPRTQRFSGGSARIAAAGKKWATASTVRPVSADTVATGGSGNGRGPLTSGWPRASSGFTHSPESALNYLFDSWAENVTQDAAGNDANNHYYEDPDDVVRPGDSWRADYATGDGVPLYHYDQLAPTRDRRRPVILNRPFRSVGELSYAFRDQPFKTLDFWSEKSPDAGLLDLFTVSARTSTQTAAQVNPNAATPAVLTALLSGAGKQAATNTTLDAATVTRLVDAVTAAGIQQNRSALGDRLGQTIFSALTNAADPGEFRNKTYGEAPMRALASVTTTRAWNFLVDVVAQSGRLAPNAGGLQDFLVEGERRYWLHIAIDRHTGEILDQQLEPVLE